MKKYAELQWVFVRRISYPMMYVAVDRYVRVYSIKMTTIRINVDAQHIVEQT